MKPTLGFVVVAAPALCLVAAPLPAQQKDAAGLAVPTATVPVTVKNFQRAETDMYFSKSNARGGLGKLYHFRTPTPIDKQDVVRMNRDTLYSNGVFDLDAGPVTITLPDPGSRFMSLLTVDEDHYNPPVVYAPGTYTFTRDKVGTRYVFLAIRTLADPNDPADIKAANALQDRIEVKQRGDRASSRCRTGTGQHRRRFATRSSCLPA